MATLAPQSHGPGQTNLPSIHIHLRSVPSQAPLRFLIFFVLPDATRFSIFDGA